jgi:hypothetical protein
MNSALLALFLRSVREDARGWRTYGARGLLGGFVLLVLLPFSLTNTWLGAPGRDFLIVIVTLQIIAVTFVGLSYFTSAITEEKEEFTIGLLRMTGLSPLSILLGKSTSRLCGALLLLTSQIPFTIFAITLGGVSLRQVAAVYFTLMAYTFFLSNLALLGSVLARRTMGAAMFCVSILALWLAASPLLTFVHDTVVKPAILKSICGAAARGFREALPTSQLHQILRTGFAGPIVGWQGVSNVAAGLGCFLLAWALFGAFCDRRAEDQSVVDITLNVLPGRRRSRPPRVWSSAVFWKDFHFLWGGLTGLSLRVLGYGAMALLLENRSFVWIPFIYSLELSLLASRVFRIELNDRTLAGLATLPCGMRQVALAKSRACLIMAIPGGLATIIVVLLALREADGAVWMGAFVAVCGAISMFVLVHIVAWLSLRMKRGAFALGYVVTIFACAFGFGYCAVIVGSILSSNTPGLEWWINLVISIVAICVFGTGAIAPAWMLRGSIPAELADLAGEE